MTVSPQARYLQEIQQPGIQQDPAQEVVIEKLDALWQALSAQPARPGLLGRIRSWANNDEQNTLKGVYVWGGVGRGKTWLMDMFFDQLPFDRKLRTHFHRFMRRIHRDLKALQSTRDPLDKVAENIAREARVLCFDEFFVSDITDAMILARLLKALFERKVILIATSNVEPVNLYKDGLQRSNFLPAIDLLYQHCDVINLDSATDYRLRALEQADLFYSPLSEQAHQALGACFERLVPDTNAIRANTSLEVEGRSLLAYREAEDVVWFDFKALCDGPRSQNDYIELAREYHAVIVENVPIFNGNNDDQARRFINLVDEFYDRGVKLIMSAEADIRQLYASGRLSFEFERTISRILEMQSTEYLARSHKA